MSTKVIKYLNIGLGIVLGISVLLILNLLSNMDNTAQLASSLDSNFYWTYLLLGIGAAAILIYSLIQTFSSVETTKKSLIPVGASCCISFGLYDVIICNTPVLRSSENG